MDGYYALLKTPLILTKAWLFWASLTPPNPPALEEDREEHSGFEHVFAWMIRWPPLFAKLAFAADALAEFLCIPATAFPSPLSAFILHIFGASPLMSLSKFDWTPMWTVGIILAIAGGALRVSAFRALGRHFTFELAIFRDHTLITSGPYSFVRHPSYTGLLLLVWGMSMCIGAPGSYAHEVLWMNVLRGEALGESWAPYARVFAAIGLCVQLVVVGALIARTKAEDEMLRREFGKQWHEWVERTPWRLFPGLY